MKTSKVSFVFLLALIGNAGSLFAGDVTAKIIQLTCAKTGTCTVYINAPVPSITCTYKDILTWNIAEPMGKEFLSMAMTYKVIDKPAFFSSISGCNADGTSKLDLVRLP